MLGSLGQITSHAAASFGEATALVCEGRSFSFRDVDALPTTSSGKIMRRELSNLDA